MSSNTFTTFRLPLPAPGAKTAAPTGLRRASLASLWSRPGPLLARLEAASLSPLSGSAAQLHDRPRPRLLPGGARRGRPLNDTDFSTDTDLSSSSDEGAGDDDGVSERGAEALLSDEKVRVLFYVTVHRADADPEELANDEAHSLLEGYRGRFTLGQLRAPDFDWAAAGEE